MGLTGGSGTGESSSSASHCSLGVFVFVKSDMESGDKRVMGCGGETNFVSTILVLIQESRLAISRICGLLSGSSAHDLRMSENQRL